MCAFIHFRSNKKIFELEHEIASLKAHLDAEIAKTAEVLPKVELVDSLLVCTICKGLVLSHLAGQN